MNTTAKELALALGMLALTEEVEGQFLLLAGGAIESPVRAASPRVAVKRSGTWVSSPAQKRAFSIGRSTRSVTTSPQLRAPLPLLTTSCTAASNTSTQTQQSPSVTQVRDFSKVNQLVHYETLNVAV